MSINNDNSAENKKPKVLETPSVQKAFFYNTTIDQVSAGILAAFTSTSILHPLDLIKIRLQVEAQSSGSIWGRSLRALNSAMIGIDPVKTDVKPTFKNRLVNFKKLYVGLSPNIAGNCISWGMYFGWYNWIKGQMSTNPFFNSNTNTQNLYKNNQQGVSFLSAKHHLFASSMAGILTQLVANPVWIVKVRMCQPEIPGKSQIKYSGVIDGLIKIAQKEGLRGYYKGLSAGIIGVSHGALQFMAYEEMKKYLALKKYNKSENNTFGTLEYLLMSVSSKLFASVVTYPYQGFQGFYKGLAPNIIRVLPGTMITFLVYEKASLYFRTHSN
ncbi:hypothetical protein BB561_005281 [Smittium simulii]|uniref:Uncharacterized protein n=1 Tax=Smittium simulii TaxID=133385 RepID=A0A2T9YB89_9FUNG|nr:hypothetical protein BB561_005281 [Smittium simulii]